MGYLKKRMYLIVAATTDLGYCRHSQTKARTQAKPNRLSPTQARPPEVTSADLSLGTRHAPTRNP